MRAIAFLCLLSLQACNCGDNELYEALGQPCFTHEHSKRVVDVTVGSREYEVHNTGACMTGHIARNENNEVYCHGEVRSSPEVCDGIDNDCNGITDDPEMLDFHPTHHQNGCTANAHGECLRALSVCDGGVRICKYPNTVGREVCDGLDNDCDGLIDEDTAEEPLFTDRFFYDGPPNTVNVGECRAGSRHCVGGRTTIRGMILPQPEICNNGRDDDCNGFVDESTEEDAFDSDNLFIVDMSGSMGQYMRPIREVICRWSGTPQLRSSRFAVIAIGYGPHDWHDWSATYSHQMYLISDFVSAEELCASLATAPIPTWMLFDEYQPDALIAAFDTESELFLSWAPNRRRNTFIYTDEHMQSRTYRTPEDMSRAMQTTCIANATTVYAFIESGTPHRSYWRQVSATCQGSDEVYALSNDASEMFESMNSLIVDNCMLDRQSP